MALFQGVAFFFIKLSDRTRYGFIFRAVVILCFEWLRTLGFLGFGYGIIGYSQYEIPFFIRTASFAGVWGISFLIYLFASLCAEIIFNARNIHDAVKNLKSLKIEAFCYMVLLTAFICYGAFKPEIQYSKSIKVAIIQNNEDPWKDGIDEYEIEVEHLIELTESAFARDDKIQLVVWPETAVVPDIINNYNVPVETRRSKLASRVVNYISSKKASFVTGNNYNESSGNKTESFNSALYFSSSESHKKVVEVYNKMHLVPFSEYFPFAKILSPLYNKMVESGSHFWTPGKEIKIFECDGVRFSTPICFEDTFTEIPKKMKKSGSELIVNLSNDSWSHSLSCQNQHLAMAAFRSAENQIPSVRSTCSGQTCVINAEGKIISELKPFTKGVLIYEVPIR